MPNSKSVVHFLMKDFGEVSFSCSFFSDRGKQAGAELCQAQGKLILFWP